MDDRGGETMMKHGVRKFFSLLTALCLLLSACPALAQTADFDALSPLMDLVCAACSYSANAPESVPDADGTLTVSFTDAFFKIGQSFGERLGITENMLEDLNAQAEYLGKVFAAQLPALEPVMMTDDVGGYIGFQPVTVNNGTDGSSVQIIGEMYMADRPMSELSAAEYAQIVWLDRAVFTFQSDASALNGFRLTGFTMGTDLSMEEAFMGYDHEILVEYESSLGFIVLYPSFFEDDMLTETAEGVSAALKDGSVSFFAKRTANVNHDNLSDYVSLMANSHVDSASTVVEAMQYGTVAYTTEDGFFVFDVYILTDDYIYQAELKYTADKLSEYAMYNAYLENSFVVNELSQG